MSRLSEIFRPDRPLSGLSYFIWGTALFCVKYPLDHFVATIVFDKKWSPVVYFSFYMNPLFDDRKSTVEFWLGMLLVALPFLALGIGLTIRRLATLGLAPLWSLFFFIPFLNVSFFLLLSVWSFEVNAEPRTYEKDRWFLRLIPENKILCATVCLLFGALLGVLAFLGMENFWYDFGVTTFLGVPFLLGFLTVAVMSVRWELNPWNAVLLSALPILIGNLILVVTFIEGIVCVLMALPVALPVSMLGGALACAVYSRRPIGIGSGLKSIFILPLFLAADSAIHRTEDWVVVESEVEVSATDEETWKNVVAFPTIEEPWDGPFWFYIPKLERALLEGEGVGALRRCEFDQGVFEESITEWDKPHRLTFRVLDQIERLKPYLKVTQGQFLLERNGPNSIRLIGKTWYRPKVFPRIYWNGWASFFIHRIHLRALHQIKKLSEDSANSENAKGWDPSSNSSQNSGSVDHIVKAPFGPFPLTVKKA